MKLIDMTNNLADKILEYTNGEGFAEYPDNVKRGEITAMIYDAVKEFVDANWGAER